MEAAPPPIGAATVRGIIGARGTAGATANACPQFKQNAALSAIAPPQLEQYTVVPRFFLAFGDRKNRSQILLSSNGRVNSFIGQRPGGKKSIALVPNSYSSRLPANPRIFLISHVFIGKEDFPPVLVHFLPPEVAPVKLKREEILCDSGLRFA